jgi:FkbM family methyltransferase
MDKTILRQLIKRQNPVILELGAHHGEDSANFRAMYPNGDLFLFEPDKRCIQIIKDLGLGFQLYEGVMSDVDGEVLFHASGTKGKSSGDGSGSIMLPSKHIEYFPAIPFIDDYMVNSVTLRTFMLWNQLPFIDFIWADVQGAEERIIMGGLEEFNTKVGVLFTEYCQEELYVGAPKRERIMDLLPAFDVVYDVGSNVCGDMLLVNRNF